MHLYLTRSKSRSRKEARHQTPTSLGEERSNQVKPTESDQIKKSNPADERRFFLTESVIFSYDEHVCVHRWQMS